MLDRIFVRMSFMILNATEVSVVWEVLRRIQGFSEGVKTGRMLQQGTPEGIRNLSSLLKISKSHKYLSLNFSYIEIIPHLPNVVIILHPRPSSL